MISATPSSRAPAVFGCMPLLLREKKRFAALVTSMRDLAVALEVGIGAIPVGLEPPKLIDELGSVLAEHFQDADDCLHLVAERRSDLLPAVVDMRADHATLLQALDDLRVLVADEGSWAELPFRLATLLEQLALHRECEAALVREANRVAGAA